MFNNMDTDGSGTITFEELKVGLSRLGSQLTEGEVRQLLDAVRNEAFNFYCYFGKYKVFLSCVFSGRRGQKRGHRLHRVHHCYDASAQT